MEAWTLRWWVWWVILVPIAGAAQPAPGHVQAHYELGSDFAGHAVGDCEASAAFVSPVEGRILRFTSHGGELVVYRIDVNYTLVRAPGQHILTQNDGQFRKPRFDVAAGEGEVRMRERSRVDVYGGTGPDDVGTPPFGASFDSSRFTTSSVQGGFHPLQYPEEFPGIPGMFAVRDHGVAGANRMVRPVDGRLALNGSVWLYLEDVELWLRDGIHSLEPRVLNISASGVPGTAEAGHQRWTFAFLRLDAAALDAPPGATVVACQGLRASLAGTLTTYLARGEITAGNRRIPFERQELTMEGVFDWRETSAKDGVAAEGVGDFRVASLDFVPVLDHRAPLIARVGFWAGVLALAAGIAYFASKALLPFFSRLSEEAVANHASRRLVLDAVRANPNVTLRGLVGVTNLSKSEIRYHVRVLETRGLVRSHKVRRDRCYVARDTIRTTGRQVLEVTPELVARNDPVVGHVVQRVPPHGVRLNPLLVEVAQALGISRVGAWKAVRRAEKHNLIMLERNGREVWVRSATQP